MSTDEITPQADAPEPPPRGVLLMAIVRWLLLLAMTALAVYTVHRYGLGGRGEQTVREARYYCPMHPQITSPDPGECPICHMTLEPIPHDRARTSVASASDASVMQATADASVDANTNEPVMLSLDRRQAIDVATTPVTRRAVHEALTVPASVSARENGVSQVHVRSAAFIERVAVRATGVRVGTGEVLAWMYSPAIYRAEQDMFTASRWAGDADSGAPSEGSRMAAAARESLRLLGVADRDIDAIVRAGAPQRTVPLRATGAGVITQRSAVPGQYAQPETVLYEITDLSRVWVNASVFERDLPRVHRGDAAQFRANGETAWIDARVALVEPSIDPATRTARARLDVANPAMQWRPGAFGEVRFGTVDRDALTVPRDAVIDTGDAKYVFVDVGDGRFEARRVQTGATVGENTEISAGLREGESVVTRGGFLIDAESRLRAAVTPGGAR